MRSPTAFLIGAGTVYFFDPQLGKRRRAGARDRTLKALRDAGRTFAKKGRFAAGKAEGVYAEARAVVTDADVATDDATVEQRIRSEAFRAAGVPAKGIEVEVRDGVATLSGPVSDDKQAADLVGAVAKVAGVDSVTTMLRIERP